MARGERMVSPEVAQIITEREFFGYRAPVGSLIASL
jgi:hypothetical protein